VIHRLESYPCFSFSTDRGSEPRRQWLLRREAASVGQLATVRKKRQSCGRPQAERRLFKPSQCQRRRLHGQHAHLDKTSNRDRYPNTLTSIHEPVCTRVRLAAPGFHAENRPSSPDATGDVRHIFPHR